MKTDRTGSVDRLGALLSEARRAVALTGAGVSTESGIPDFRGDGGLWEDADIESVASIGGFLRDPGGFYAFWREKFARLVDAAPNPAHRLLARLEERGRLRAVVTQNIDGLHARAGSRCVHEVHGTFQTARCLGCRESVAIAEVFERAATTVPRCEACGGLLKPDVVLFGESLPPAFPLAVAEVEQSDLLLVLGSSLEVYPVADLVLLAMRHGARVALVNRDRGPFDDRADLVIHAELGATMTRLADRLNVEL